MRVLILGAIVFGLFTSFGKRDEKRFAALLLACLIGAWLILAFINPSLAPDASQVSATEEDGAGGGSVAREQIIYISLAIVGWFAGLAWRRRLTDG